MTWMLGLSDQILHSWKNHFDDNDDDSIHLEFTRFTNWMFIGNRGEAVKETWRDCLRSLSKMGTSFLDYANAFVLKSEGAK